MLTSTHEQTSTFQILEAAPTPLPDEPVVSRTARYARAERPRRLFVVSATGRSEISTTATAAARGFQALGFAIDRAELTGDESNEVITGVLDDRATGAAIQIVEVKDHLFTSGTTSLLCPPDNGKRCDAILLVANTVTQADAGALRLRCLGLRVGAVSGPLATTQLAGARASATLGLPVLSDKQLRAGPVELIGTLRLNPSDRDRSVNSHQASDSRAMKRTWTASTLPQRISTKRKHADRLGQPWRCSGENPDGFTILRRRHLFT